MEVLNRHYRIVTQDTFRGKATQALPDINIAQISVEYQGILYPVQVLQKHIF